ncbi:MAG: tRNA pseudouridine32 synthase/23S rRNA pseudouridine746 synthase [Pseudoalteromonas tetraodonis]|jgi:tRNA pseudouridine32 synthase/23S rRNA pseudouridine746 synthase
MSERPIHKQTPLRLQQEPYIVPQCDATYELLLERPEFIIVSKPSGLLTVPGRHPLNQDSLSNRLSEVYDTPRIVHRLDMDTSGILVVGLTQAAASEFGKLFQGRAVDKEYVAVVDGLIEADRGHIDFPLIADWVNRPLNKVCYATGKKSHTEFEVLERDEKLNRTRVKLIPHTGRSHQLRIHMREIGHSIIGCDMYASDEICYAGDRLMLHARYIGFDDPFTGDRIDVSFEASF